VGGKQLRKQAFKRSAVLPPAILLIGAALKGRTSMPKMKTKSSAKKRFRVRPGGTVKSGHAFKRHILTKKTTKSKRQLRGITNVDAADVKSVMRMMPSA
jgi:large subunit ribosomal protein L35